MKITNKIILFFLFSIKTVYAGPLIDRCQSYFIKYFTLQPELSLNLNEPQMERRFMDTAFKIVELKNPSSAFAKYKRFKAYQIIKNILDNQPSSSLKLRIAMLAAENYWREFGPLILMDLLNTNLGLKIQKQIISSIVLMHLNHRERLRKIRKTSETISLSMNFTESDYFKDDDSNDLLRMRMRVLEKLLEKKPPLEVQEAIAHSLGKIQHSIGVHLLEVILRENPILDVQKEGANPVLGVQKEIVRSAGLIESAKGVPILIMISQNNSLNQPLQELVIQAVENIGVEGFPVLTAMLEQDPSDGIIFQIAYYAGLWAQSLGVSMLSKILKHKSLSPEEKQIIVQIYFTGKRTSEIHHSNKDKPNNDKSSNGEYDSLPFTPE